MKLSTPIPEETPNPKVLWHFDRIDQRELPLDGKFKGLEHKGKGVTVFVIDTGVDSTHPDFEGRVKVGPSFVNGNYKELTTNNSDFNGHGTCVSGLITSKSYGLATEANVIVLKVFDESGGDSIGIAAAIQHAARNVHKIN